MPRGMHPNSRKALEENRHKGMFNADTAVEAKKQSTKSFNKNRTFREEFQLELSTIIKDKQGNETTVKNAITKALIQKALKGDIRAAEYVRDTVGEKPSDTVELISADFTELDKLREQL